MMSNVALERAPWHPTLGVEFCIDYVRQQLDALTNPVTKLVSYHIQGRQSPSDTIYVLNKSAAASDAFKQYPNIYIRYSEERGLPNV